MKNLSIDFRVVKLVFLFSYIFLNYFFIFDAIYQIPCIILLIIITYYRYSIFYIPPVKILLPVVFLLLSPIIYSMISLDIPSSLVQQFFYFLILLIVLYNYSIGITIHHVCKALLISLTITSLFLLNDINDLITILDFWILAILICFRLSFFVY